MHKRSSFTVPSRSCYNLYIVGYKPNFKVRLAKIGISWKPGTHHIGRKVMLFILLLLPLLELILGEHGLFDLDGISCDEGPVLGTDLVVEVRGPGRIEGQFDADSIGIEAGV